ELAEADDRRRASVRISAPGVRAGTRHGHPHSDDRGATGAVGESLTLRVRVQVAPCSSIVALFAHFFALRGGTPPALPTQCELPFSAAWALLEHKYNRDNWDEATALYTTDCTPASAHFYQTGWCGGGLATLPLLACGSALSRARALRNLSAIFAHSAAPAGGFFGKCRRDGQWEADHAHNQNHRHARRWHLVRRDADMLYYLQKQVHIINADPALRALVADMAGWHAVLRRGADAFVRRWDTQHQGGHFIDQVTGVILVGGSASAGLAPAGLILAWQHYGTACYRRVAEALARYFYEHFIARGYTTGGPGDACQCPDSESAGALLESFVVLFEVTGAPEWLAMARDAAHHCASWVASYDYEFPATSLFGRRGMRSTGAVFANVQNKHGAPGLCTHSGVSLFKLFRATGDARYLALLRDIAHCIPQCVARDDRPLSDPSGRAMPSGWINERFNTSDWDNNIGGILYGSCWCEIACMLTCAEVPGVYVQSDTGLLCILDHVTGHVRKDADATLLTLTNPTRFAATVAVFIERSDEVQRPLGLDTLRGVRRISLPAGATTHINLAGP
ncbi:MAG: hypothetical protein NTV22_07245, partial [bacterium]|nr:hypothetical protein [bacterium]